METLNVNLNNLTAKERTDLLLLVKKSNVKDVYPQERTPFWFVTSYNKVGYQCNFNRDNEEYVHFFESGNFFLTKEEARFEIERRNILADMRMFALMNNEGNVEGNCKKFAFLLSTVNSIKPILEVGCFTNTTSYNAIYFSSSEIANDCICEIGEDRIKKYLFNL